MAATRTRLLTALLLAVVFGAGFVVGLAVQRTAVAEPAVSEAPADTTEERTPMYEQVGPNPDQKVLIDSIVRVHREKMRALQKEFRAAYGDLRDAYEPRYRALIDSTRTAIKGVFTPEQALRYDSLLTEYDRRRAERTSREDRD